MTTILHITTRAAWEQASASGLYAPASLHAEGFIHFSTPAQIAAVATRFYRGHTGLVVIVVDTDRLTAPLVWEAPAHPAAVESPPDAGERFPHLYGPLNLDAVLRVVDYRPRSDGTFAAPPEIAG